MLKENKEIDKANIPPDNPWLDRITHIQNLSLDMKLENMSKEELEDLLANYKMRLDDSGHYLTPPTRGQLVRMIDKLSDLVSEK